MGIERLQQIERLKDAVPEHYFHVCNGTIIRGILDLEQCLLNMSDETFQYHVNENKNDFSKWVRETLHEEAFADELLKISSKSEAQLAVVRYIIKIIAESI